MVAGAPCPYVFVVGCPRSGTTLLQRMLDAHPELTIANDTHFVVDLFDQPERIGRDLPLTPALVDRVRDYRRIFRLGLEPEDIEEAGRGCERFVDFVSRLYQVRATRAGKPLSGEKTPNFVRFIPYLRRLFPDARIIHIVRDGRDVAQSMLGWVNKNESRGKVRGPGKWDLWSHDPLATSALYWSWQTTAGLVEGSRLDRQHFLQVHYEHLVAAPERVLERISDFLEIAHAPEMAHFHQGRSRSRRHRSAKSAWLPVTPGLRDWRTELSPEDVAVFEMLAGDLLEELGYVTSGVAASASAESRIASAHQWWSARPESIRVVSC